MSLPRRLNDQVEDINNIRTKKVNKYSGNGWYLYWEVDGYFDIVYLFDEKSHFFDFDEYFKRLSRYGMWKIY